MKIKHFAGYGCVNVTKQSKKSFVDEFGNKKTKMVLVVKGNHEWGIVRNDIYDVREWIFNRFEKNFNGDDFDIEMTIQENCINDVDVATYTFIY